MTTSDPRSRVLHGAALVAPAAAIFILGATAGGPASAPAGASPAPALDQALLVPPAPHHADEVERTLAWLRTVRLPASGESPMVGGDVAPPQQPEAGGGPAVEEATLGEPGAGDVPTLRLTALLGADGGGIAVIDGRICTLGQEVARGWRLTAVRADADFIEITHEDGRVQRIGLRRPGRATP